MLIMWLTISSLSPHNLHLLFCCVLSILALILFVFIFVLFCFIVVLLVFLLIVIRLCSFLCNLRVVVSMYRPYFKSWLVVFLLLFFTHIVCLCYHWDCHYYYHYYYYKKNRKNNNNKWFYSVSFFFNPVSTFVIH